MKKQLTKQEAEERLVRLVLETRLGLELDEFMDGLVPADDPWWGEDAVLDREGAGPEKGAANLPWVNRVSSVIRVAADWACLAARHFSHDNTSNGTMIGAAAASAAKRKPVRSNHCKWRQGDLVLKLVLHDEDVTLSVDEGPDVDISQLGWIDEEAFDGDPQAVPVFHRFGVSRKGARHFVVDAPSGDVSDRFSAIKAVEKAGASDVRTWLPFVEWN